eukprot:TRINITY_DN8546_c0_g1_i1.p1 TRINITY_DN8546_c0_g1~~TRINITY_DN8546_c0_g1_i1.p1  ORF type:complete len:747 (+),score=103.85 TRINITY_DN8546_c0_g1_i1:56-2296(+)
MKSHFIMMIVASFFIITSNSLSSRNDTTIRFGTSLSTLPPFEATRQIFGALTLQGIRFAVDILNEQGGVDIDGVNYNFSLVFHEDEGNATKMVGNYAKMIQDNSVDFLIGPVASDFHIMASSVTSPDHIMVGTSAGSPVFYKREKCVGVATAADLQFESSLPELRLAGAKKIVVVKSGHTVMAEACGGINDRASLHGLEVIGSHIVDTSIAGVDSDTIANISDTIKDVKEMYVEDDIDVLMICVFPPGGYEIMKSLKEHNLNPKAVVSAIFPGDWNGFNSSIVNYITGFTAFHPNATYEGDTFGSTAQFIEDFQDKYPTSEPGDLTVFGSIAALILKKAVEAAQSFDQELVFANILGLDLDTYIGKFRFSGDHAQQFPFIYVQLIDGERHIVSPFQIKETNLVYPFPRWDERELKPEISVSEIVLFAISGAGILLVISFILFILKNKNRPAILASSPLFLVAIGIGCIIAISSIFFWAPITHSTVVSCHLRFWLLGIGFSITFGSLFSKTWRIARMFDASTLEVYTVTDQDIVKITSVVCVIQAIVLFIYSLSGVRSVIEIVDSDRALYNYHYCEDSTFGIIMLAILGGFSLILLFVGVILSVLIHNRVTDKKFNESKIIGFMIYNLFFFFVVAVSLQFADIERYFLFDITSICIIGAMVITIVSIWINRAALFKKTEVSGNQSSKFSGSGNASNTTVSRLKRKNTRLLIKLEEMENLIDMYVKKFGELSYSESETDSVFSESSSE